MKSSARFRLENALANVGCRYKVPRNLIKQASLSNDIDIKIECFNQWAKETEEFKKQAERELGDEFRPYRGWRDMPVEKAIEILEV